MRRRKRAGSLIGAMAGVVGTEGGEARGSVAIVTGKGCTVWGVYREAAPLAGGISGWAWAKVLRQQLCPALLESAFCCKLR